MTSPSVSRPGFGRTNYLATGLQFLSFMIDDRTLIALLEPVETAIATAEERLRELPNDDPEDEAESAWADSVREESSDLIEQLVGVGFVIVQTYITTARSAAIKLSALHERERGAPPSFAGSGQGKDILRYSSPLLPSGYSEIQIVNSVANYWKHSEEWSHNWDKLKGPKKVTADQIRTIGATSGSSGNLRRMATALGMTNRYSDFTPIREKARLWAGGLYGLAEAEIKI